MIPFKNCNFCKIPMIVDIRSNNYRYRCNCRMNTIFVNINSGLVVLHTYNTQKYCILHNFIPVYFSIDKKVRRSSHLEIFRSKNGQTAPVFSSDEEIENYLLLQ